LINASVNKCFDFCKLILSDNLSHSLTGSKSLPVGSIRFSM
jgi:hypothetical protein